MLGMKQDIAKTLELARGARAQAEANAAKCIRMSNPYISVNQQGHGYGPNSSVQSPYGLQNTMSTNTNGNYDSYDFAKGHTSYLTHPSFNAANNAQTARQSMRTTTHHKPQPSPFQALQAQAMGSGAAALVGEHAPAQCGPGRGLASHGSGYGLVHAGSVGVDSGSRGSSFTGQLQMQMSHAMSGQVMSGAGGTGSRGNSFPGQLGLQHAMSGQVMAGGHANQQGTAQQGTVQQAAVQQAAAQQAAEHGSPEPSLQDLGYGGNQLWDQLDAHWDNQEAITQQAAAQQAAQPFNGLYARETMNQAAIMALILPVESEQPAAQIAGSQAVAKPVAQPVAQPQQPAGAEAAPQTRITIRVKPGKQPEQLAPAEQQAVQQQPAQQHPAKPQQPAQPQAEQRKRKHEHAAAAPAADPSTAAAAGPSHAAPAAAAAAAPAQPYRTTKKQKYDIEAGHLKHTPFSVAWQQVVTATSQRLAAEAAAAAAQQAAVAAEQAAGAAPDVDEATVDRVIGRLMAQEYPDKPKDKAAGQDNEGAGQEEGAGQDGEAAGQGEAPAGEGGQADMDVE